MRSMSTRTAVTAKTVSRIRVRLAIASRWGTEAVTVQPVVLTGAYAESSFTPAARRPTPACAPWSPCHLRQPGRLRGSSLAETRPRSPPSLSHDPVAIRDGELDALRITDLVAERLDGLQVEDGGDDGDGRSPWHADVVDDGHHERLSEEGALVGGGDVRGHRPASRPWYQSRKAKLRPTRPGVGGVDVGERPRQVGEERATEAEAAVRQATELCLHVDLAGDARFDVRTPVLVGWRSSAPAPRGRRSSARRTRR
jgi:hypothetical protein